MLEENWCEVFSKPLAVFNKAFIRRLGKGLHPYVLLSGTKEDCEYCAQMEAKLFYDNGIYESDQVLHISDGITVRGVYLEETWNKEDEEKYQKAVDNGSLLVYMAGEVKRANHYDVSGCMDYSFKKKFLEATGMSCKDSILDTVFEKYPDIIFMDIESVANNTLLKHYENNDDDIIQESDFDWLLNDEYKPDIKDTDTDVTEETDLKKSETKPEIQQIAAQATMSESQKNKDDSGNEGKTVSKENADAGKESSVEEETKVQHSKAKAVSEKPRKKKRNAYGLTEEDEANNAALLSEVRNEYESLLKYIVSLRASLWKPIERIIRSSLETNDYSESVILKYLEISQDVTTELYKRLYEKTEPVRRKLNDGVKRKFKKLVCYNCSASWKVDITFMDKEHDESECPICNTLVGYDNT